MQGCLCHLDTVMQKPNVEMHSYTIIFELTFLSQSIILVENKTLKAFINFTLHFISLIFCLQGNIDTVDPDFVTIPSMLRVNLSVIDYF